MLLMFENKPLKKIVGNRTDAPYLNSLVDACSYAKNDQSLSTTSLANYVALTSGYTGCAAIDASGTCTSPKLITSNQDPKVWPQASKSIFELMGANAVQWGESQPGNCPITEKSADYAINHTPFAYYTRTQTTLCPQNARPFPRQRRDDLVGEVQPRDPKQEGHHALGARDVDRAADTERRQMGVDVPAAAAELT
ncbi:MAG: hypothetical protein WCG47_24880 [Dermatophilaceae bacterium]